MESMRRNCAHKLRRFLQVQFGALHRIPQLRLVAARRGLWEIRYDPYDISRIWVRNHHDQGFLEATWTHLHTAPVPFGELTWAHAREIVAARSSIRTGDDAQAVSRGLAGPCGLDQGQRPIQLAPPFISTKPDHAIYPDCRPEFIAAFERLGALLRSPDVAGERRAERHAVTPDDHGIFRSRVSASTSCST